MRNSLNVREIQGKTLQDGFFAALRMTALEGGFD
jgi:hypothetical protein